MKVMVIEDRPQTLKQISEKICDYEELNGVEVIRCRDLDYANQFISRNEEIDVIICDLSLEPIGFSEDECRQAQTGVLTGLVWLLNHIYNENYELTKIIIFSDFLDALKRYLIKASNEEIYFCNKIVKIPKAGKDRAGYRFLLEVLLDAKRGIWNPN